MRRSTVALTIAATMLWGTPVAVADVVEEPFAGDIDNVDHLGLLEDTSGAVAIEFLTYGNGSKAREVLVLSGTFGLKTYDLADPAAPVLLDELPAELFLLPTDDQGFGRGFWQNEDMNVDHDRKLVFMARDPRAFVGSTSDPAAVAGVYFVDASDPEDLQFAAPFHELPVGHTSTCINSCDYLWTGGPASNTEQQAIWPGGRPIFVTDVRDMDDITTSPIAIDLFRNDGVTDYAHDVQVDEAGIAWVSGRGGVRGYHTSGKHVDPLSGERRRATPTDPVPFAGGETDNADTPSTFMHNSERPTLRDQVPGWSRNGYRPGSLVMATEEAFGSNTCDGIGVFVIARLDGSYDGEAWRSTEADPFRLETVSTWSPADVEAGTSDSAPFCSAHYFDRDATIVAYSWYAQGTRFLDISDPANPIQVAYFRPDDTVSFAPYFHDGLVYVADIGRGVDVLRLQPEAYEAGKNQAPVDAPRRSARSLEVAQRVATRFEADELSGYLCLLPIGL